MKNPYEILGLNPDASDGELQERYAELKAKYSEDRFLPGAEGNEAAKNLSELEIAWSDIQRMRTSAEAKRDYGSDYGYIDNLIKEGKYDEAQKLLDGISVRPGEWHYLQSIIFYKREWLTESRAQLQMAVNSEPWNDKYKTALDRLNVIMGSPKTDPNTIGRTHSEQVPPQNEGQMCGNTCSSCCLAYCLTDCCCSLAQCC